MQLGALGITLVISILSGSLCGYLASHVGKSGEDNQFALFMDDGHFYEEHGTIDYNLDHETQIASTALQASNEIAAKVAAFANEDASQAQSEEAIIAEKKAAKKKEKKDKKRAEKKALENETPAEVEVADD